MNCNEAMEMLLAGGKAAEGAELRAHLAKCRDCAASARLLQALETAPRQEQPEPALEVDASILAYASGNAKANKQSRFVKRMSFSLAAAAATIALCLSAIFCLPQQKPAASGISWDSVALDEELFRLSSEIERCASSLNPAKPEQIDYSDVSFQVLSVEVPDFNS